MSESSYRAVVIGATGAVGSALVRELLASTVCDRVVALTRRPADSFGPADRLRVHVVGHSNDVIHVPGVM